MPDYDFHQLSPYDLEILARDLLQAHWGVRIESFKTGKDGGVDLRYASGPGRVIVQVKHFARTSVAGLLRELKAEALKVRRLKPSRYVLVTSLPLSVANVDEIVSIFGADVLTSADVFGREALNNLLGLHSAVEGKHYKLWLASRAVLDRVVNNASVTRSEFKVRQVYEAARRYVQSSAYPEALKRLGETGVVVIAGPPGVGKSTLANLLLYEHVEKGYQAILIQRDIVEGQQLFQQGVRQVFYFDDFMGATFVGDQAGNPSGLGDRALLDFIAMVRASPNARLILTTREHIYSQTVDRSERLRQSDLDDLRVFLRLPSYSFSQKARILYNHLYFSDLPAPYRAELLRDGFYLTIIRHQKFSPRLIEWLSSFRLLRNVPVKNYRKFVEELLKDPSEIWRHAYEREISDAGRSVLLAMFSLKGKAAGLTLRGAFRCLHQERAVRYRFPTKPEDFRSGLREVAGGFVKPVGSHLIEVVDPSILDLLNAVVRRSPENAVDILAGAASFEQIEHTWMYVKSNQPVLDVVRQEASRFMNTLQMVMLKSRRVDLGSGVVGYRDSTFERRLAVIVEMADRLSSAEIAALVDPLFTRLQDEWRVERAAIGDGVDLIRALNGAKAITSPEARRMASETEAVLLLEASGGCTSDELRELISIVDVADGESASAMAQARAAFQHYRTTMFRQELRECQSSDQFEGLIEDLDLFHSELGVAVSDLVQQVEEAKEEFEENESAYADHKQDEWKEHWHAERASERSVTEMFDSLKGDKD